MRKAISYGVSFALNRYIFLAVSQLWAGLNRYNKRLAWVNLSLRLPAHMICITKSQLAGAKSYSGYKN